MTWADAIIAGGVLTCLCLAMAIMLYSADDPEE